MGDKLNYLNNLNRPNLVDFTLLQKINDGYSYNSQPKTSNIYSLVQTAGNSVCSIAKDNIFISIIVISLILFLGWCYIEKQRLDALTEKYLQKKLAKSLLNDELNLFNEIPSPLNIEKLFNDINTDLYVEKDENTDLYVENKINNINKQEEIKDIETMNQERPVHMTKRELNIKNNDSNQNQLGSGINNNMGVNQYPSQGFAKGASRDFGQNFINQQQPTIIQNQQPQQGQQPVYQQQPQQAQQPVYQQPQQGQQPVYQQPQQAQQPVYQQPQQAQQPVYQQQPQQGQQQPVYQQALSQDGLVNAEQNIPQPMGGSVGSSRYMDISGGFNKNSYMLM
jgi:hypothetical protein